MSLLHEYQLTKKIGYFTLDNAKNKDAALRCLSQRPQEVGVSFDPQAHHLQCIGNIINLVVKAFLYGIDADYEVTKLNDSSNWILSS